MRDASPIFTRRARILNYGHPLIRAFDLNAREFGRDNLIGHRIVFREGRERVIYGDDPETRLVSFCGLRSGRA